MRNINVWYKFKMIIIRQILKNNRKIRNKIVYRGYKVQTNRNLLTLNYLFEKTRSDII